MQGLSATITGLALGNTYRVSVHGSTDEVDGADAVTDAALVAVGKAAIETLDFANDAMNVTWKALADATGYTCELAPQGKPEQPYGTVTVATPATSAPIKIGDDLEAGPYDVRLRASAGGMAGEWSDLVAIARLNEPAVTVAFAGTAVSAEWPAVEGGPSMQPS